MLVPGVKNLSEGNKLCVFSGGAVVGLESELGGSCRSAEGFVLQVKKQPVLISDDPVESAAVGMRAECPAASSAHMIFAPVTANTITPPRPQPHPPTGL